MAEPVWRKVHGRGDRTQEMVLPNRERICSMAWLTRASAGLFGAGPEPASFRIAAMVASMSAASLSPRK